MPEATDSNAEAVASETQTQAATPDAARTAEIEAQLAKVLKHNQELAADNAKYRKRNEEEMEKAKQGGDYAKLLEAERERASASEAQVKALEPEAVIGRSIMQKAQKEVEKARADTNLPAFLRKAIAGVSPLDALEILSDYRATQSIPPPAATPMGAAPATNGAPKGLDGMSDAEILNSSPDKLDELLGRKRNGSHGFLGTFFKS